MAAGQRPHEGRGATAALLDRAGETRLGEALEAGAAWAAARAQADDAFTEAAFGADPGALRSRLAPGVGSFWSRLFGPYRGASRELATLLTGPLPKAPADRLALLDRLITIRSLRRTLSEEEGYLSELLGPDWRGERTPFSELRDQAVWLGRLTAIAPVGTSEALDRVCATSGEAERLGPDLTTARAALDAVAERLALSWDGLTLSEIEARLIAMGDGIGRYGEWSRLSALAARLETDGLGPLLALLDEGALEPGQAVDELVFATAEARWEAARAALPDLDGLAHLDRHALVKTFRGLEEARMGETRRLVRAKHLAQLPTGASGQMGFLRGEMAKQRRHKPIRQIMRAAGQMV